METKLTNIEVQDFLQNYKNNSEIEFLEEGSKEKNDLLQSAKKRGILVEGSRDLGILKTIFLFTDKPNANGAIVPSQEFQKKLPQIIGKPMDIGHERSLVVGYYIDYKYILKEKKAITYAVFFKNNFPEYWEKAKKFQKAGKLSSSFEIWSKDDRDEHNNKPYKLQKMELAGGALIFEENGEEPAFKDAKVLAIAKKELSEIIDNNCLVYASKYHCPELITANGKLKCSNCGNCEAEKIVEDKVEINKIKVINKEEFNSVYNKIKCNNCQEEFENGGIDSNIKCPKCFAIVDKTGVMIYPPQIKDFRIQCPDCSSNNWLILSKKEEEGKIKCTQCSKEYKITFNQDKNTVAEKMSFIYVGGKNCLQCGKFIEYSGVSTLKDRTLKCSCGLKFDFNTKKEKYKKITTIEEIAKKDIIKSSKKGGKETMDLDVNDKIKEVKDNDKLEATVSNDYEESKEVAKLKDQEEKSSNKKMEKEKKVEEKKVEEQPKVEETSKAKVEEPKAEETPKTEDAPKTEEVKVEKAEENKEEVKVEVEEEVKNEVKVEDEKVSEETKVDVTVKNSTEEEIKKEVEDKVEESEKVTEKEEQPKVEIVDKSEILKAGQKKLAKIVIALREDIVKIKEDKDKEIAFYKENAKKIQVRKDELGEDYIKNLTDEDLLNDDKFEKAKLEKENARLNEELENSSIKNEDVIGLKDNENNTYYDEKRKEIDSNAFDTKKNK